MSDQTLNERAAAAASLLDVARLAGVSPSTVSRALHRPDLVNAVTRERVVTAAEKLAYVPQAAGRSLVLRRTRTVGALIPRLGSSLFAETVEALRATLGAAGHTLLLAQPEDAAGAMQAPLRALLERGIDALVLLGSAHDRQLLPMIEARGLPWTVIWADALSDAAACVGFDNYEAGQLLAQHLLDLGHRRFAMISGRRALNQRAQRRYEGVVDTLAASGATLPRDLLVETEYGYRNGAEAVATLLADGPRFTALICGNDYLAVGALAGLRAAGLVVPRQVSVSGFNDSEFSAYTCPTLTTVRFPIRGIGEAAARYLLERLEGRTPSARVMLPIDLQVRESTAVAPAA